MYICASVHINRAEDKTKNIGDDKKYKIYLQNSNENNMISKKQTKNEHSMK